MKQHDDSTSRLFITLENNYNYFKQELFENNLPPAVLVSNRNVRSMGYYRPTSWRDKTTDAYNNILPEININPNILQLPAKEICATLVHEMCHHYQYSHGKPGRYGYHNIEFSRIMFSKGLMCSRTGKPGGKITGRQMSDYIIEDGLFVQVFNRMPKEFLLPFTSADDLLPIVPPSMEESNLKNRNKTKFTCPGCGANAWGKPDLNIDCHNCQTQMRLN